MDGNLISWIFIRIKRLRKTRGRFFFCAKNKRGRQPRFCGNSSGTQFAMEYEAALETPAKANIADKHFLLVR